MSRANKTRILMMKNAKFSRYYFYLNTNLYGDFQIRISVSLNGLQLLVSIFSNLRLSLSRRALKHYYMLGGYLLRKK